MTNTEELDMSSLSKGLDKDERASLAEMIRAMLLSLPSGLGAMDAGLRRRFSDAAFELETTP